jgi:hypothetical protein
MLHISGFGGSYKTTLGASVTINQWRVGYYAATFC